MRGGSAAKVPTGCSCRRLLPPKRPPKIPPELPSWEGRIGTRRFLTSTFDEATGYSRARREALAGWTGAVTTDCFDWIKEPILNPYTRLAAAMCPARGVLHTVGYDLTGAALPERVTQICEIETVAA